MSGVWPYLGVLALVAGLVVWLARVGKRAQRAEWGNAFLNRVDGLNRIFCKSFHRFEFDPIVIPEEGGAIVASNHVSGLDPPLLSCAVTRPLRFMIATEQYERPLLHWMYKAMGTIPVDRTGAPDKAFYKAWQALEKGEVIGVFPQGRITMPDESIPLKRGVVLLADLAKVPIIPVRLSGIRGMGRVISAVFIRSRARLDVGPPIRVEDSRDEEALATLKAFFDGVTRDDKAASR